MILRSPLLDEVFIELSVIQLSCVYVSYVQLDSLPANVGVPTEPLWGPILHLVATGHLHQNLEGPTTFVCTEYNTCFGILLPLIAVPTDQFFFDQTFLMDIKFDSNL